MGKELAQPSCMLITPARHGQPGSCNRSMLTQTTGGAQGQQRDLSTVTSKKLARGCCRANAQLLEPSCGIEVW